MRFTIDHAALAPALSTIGRTVPSRAVRPVLSAVLIDAHDGHVTLSATNLETAIVSAIPAAVSEEGQAALPARYLADLMRRIPGGTLTVQTDADTAGARISWARSQFTIHGHNPADYPAIAPFPSAAERQVPQGLLRHAIMHTTFAAAQGETGRALLTGVELRFTAGSLFALATDGFQAAAYATVPTAPRGDGPAVVVPASVLQEVSRLLDAADQPCDIAQQGNQILFRAGETYIAARVLEGKYFAVLDLVPAQFPTTVRLNLEAFLGACERVGVVCDADPPHAVTVDVAAGQVDLSASTADVGSAHEVLDAQVAGPSLRMGFNVRQIIEGLRHFEGPEVVLEISGPTSLSRFTDPVDARLQYLQMPLQMTN